MFAKGGPTMLMIMIPIVILLIAAIYIFFERYLSLRKYTSEPNAFMEGVKAAIKTGNVESAKQLCLSQPSPYSRMILKGITRLGSPLKNITNAVENVGNLETKRLEKRINILAIISGAAPMFGFLGTVIGMMIAFNDIAASGNVEVAGIADGINVKMITSAAGLIVGLISFFGYNILNLMMERITGQMEVTAFEFLDMLEEPAH
jgi:biopolymer transport protein ExbB